jgi:4'-phosphopantetheinyl transferase
MLTISRPDYIRCSFGPGPDSAFVRQTGKLEIFYAETKDLNSRFTDIQRYVSGDEQSRAEKFLFDKDRETYITCHAILRLIISQFLKLDPLEISFKTGLNNKPGIKGDPIHFNITHTREAFAITVSNEFQVGIDLEDINQEIEIRSIAEKYFSRKECEFIFKSETGSKNRFILLWTRKESLLKALGTGIINDLTKVEVSGRHNFLSWNSFDNLGSDNSFHSLFLYSKRIKNYYLSVAIPQKASINFYHLNKENILSYLDNK